MVKFQCQIKVRLENVAELKTNHPDYTFLLRLKCTGCGEESEKWHDLTESEKFPGKTGRSENNYIAKCKMCGRENSIDVVPRSNGTITSEDSEKYASLVTFESRGFEPVGFKPAKGWIVKVDGSATKFTDVDLGEEEWVEYDENIKDTVGVYEFQYKFVSTK